MSSIFGNKDDKMNGKLKNPNSLRESYLYEYFVSRGQDAIDKFVKSPEASIMKEQNMITDDLIERLSKAKANNKNLEMTVLHIAKAEDDPMFDRLVALRAQERDLMNELIKKYQESAVDLTNKYVDKFLNQELPKEFK